MNRLKQAIGDLNRKGYEIRSLKKLNGGINSAVFQTSGSNSMNYALKLYPLPNHDDRRNRCNAEKKFLDYLQECRVTNTPKLVESNISAGWSLISWIEGQKPKGLQSADLENIANFISSINGASTKAKRSELQPASEACKSLPSLIHSIAKRIERLKSTNPSLEPSREAIKWIIKTLEPQFQLISRRLLNSHAKFNHWQDLNACRIASPSDVGIHNTLRTKQGLHFLDFEYAGLDDLSKLAADWILQPEYQLNKEQEYEFIYRLKEKMNDSIGETWEQRLTDIKPIIKTKWCLIMLNGIQSETLKEGQLKKTIEYHGKI